MTRFCVIPPVALILIASGCFGDSTAASRSSSSSRQTTRASRSPMAYAQFQIQETYTTGSSTNHFGGDLHRVHFTLTCKNSERTYLELQGVLSRRDQLCLAILDYRKQIPPQVACGCPVSPVVVDVRGTVRGRSVHEQVTPCLCGDGPKAASDARVILSTHPPL